MTMKMMMKGWDDVSINDYYRIVDIIEDEERSEEDKNFSVLAVLCRVDEEDIYNLGITEASRLMAQTKWMNEFKFNSKWKESRLRIGGEDYDVCVDLQRMTVSQYMDFQTFWGKKDLRRYYGNILSCFIVPRGKKYCDGYDAMELAEKLRDSMSIALANAVCFFFLKELRSSIQATLIYLDWMMKKMQKKGTPEMQARIEEAQQLIEKLRTLSIGSL